MDTPEASINVAVDPTNPGQFFACCGLLELADRLWPGAEGWFEINGRSFNVTCGGTIRELLTHLANASVTEITRIEPAGLDAKALIAPLAISFGSDFDAAITLDAWMQIRLLKGVSVAIANPPWNFWSGQQTSKGIWNGLRAELATQLDRLSEDALGSLFVQRLFQKGRFGFDPGPAWNALDVGFSPNEQSIEVESSPAVELLAAIGLQRFRPHVSDDRTTFEYAIWTYPLLPSIAAAAMSGTISHLSPCCFRGCVVSRGQYAALGFSFPLLQGETDEWPH